MDESQEIKELRREVAELKARLDRKDTQQLQFPLDTASFNVIAEALRTNSLESIMVKDIFFKRGLTVNPAESGQMNYFDGASKGIRIHVNGFTGQLDATSI
jgi:hypothetical protein